MRGVLHRIEEDLAGNLGIAWTVAFCDWARFGRWLEVWT